MDYDLTLSGWEKLRKCQETSDPEKETDDLTCKVLFKSARDVQIYDENELAVAQFLEEKGYLEPGTGFEELSLDANS